MCGRFALTATPEEVAALFGLADLEAFPPRYNIAPTQPILLVKRADDASSGGGQPVCCSLLARWGLWPGWMKDPANFPVLFNARAETAAEKASFRAAMRHRRVLIPASGFYEWKRAASGRKGRSQPYWIRPRDASVVAFAGVMETWSSPDGSEIDTAAILTTASCGPCSSIHPRMPLVVPPAAFQRWLDCRTAEPRMAPKALDPPFDAFETTAVSSRVNAAAKTGADIQTPVDPDDDGMAKSDGSDQHELF